MWRALANSNPISPWEDPFGARLLPASIHGRCTRVGRKGNPVASFQACVLTSGGETEAAPCPGCALSRLRLHAQEPIGYSHSPDGNFQAEWLRLKEPFLAHLKGKRSLWMKQSRRWAPRLRSQSDKRPQSKSSCVQVTFGSCAALPKVNRSQLRTTTPDAAQSMSEALRGVSQQAVTALRGPEFFLGRETETFHTK